MTPEMKEQYEKFQKLDEEIKVLQRNFMQLDQQLNENKIVEEELDFLEVGDDSTKLYKKLGPILVVKVCWNISGITFSSKYI